MRTSFLKLSLLFFVTVALFASCDKDFNEIGSGIVGDDHFGFSKDSLFSVKATNQFYGAVQTSKTTTSSIDMPINSLGFYNNPVFGKVTASFVTQLELASVNPTIDLDLLPHVKKVELNIPYFSTLTDTDDDGNHLYELDSIQGNSKIKLNVYASGYYLRDFDPATGLQEIQKYYSDQTPEIDAAKEPLRLNDTAAVSQNDQFFFDPAEIVTYKTVNGLQQVDTRRSPELRMRLRNDYFESKLLSAGSAGKLLNNNIFKDWVRGLYFKAESISNEGSLAQMNFKQGKITVTYSVLTNRKDSTGAYILDEFGHRERSEKTIVLNLAGNTVNLFENEYNAGYISGVTNVDPVNGDSRLYLKGGAGSMAIIDLFGSADAYHYVDNDNDSETPNVIASGANGVPDELDDVREKKWLINDASLTFFMDEAAMGSAHQPLRVYLYDLTNRRPLLDYTTDVTTVSGFPKFNKYIHGGLLEKNEDGSRKRYTVRITNHIKNLVKADIDSTNVRLGLVVTENIGNVSNVKLKTQVSTIIDRVPAAAVSHQNGVILYGNTPDVPDDKKLKLRIYYTKPN
jgi:hypothetical protein